MRVTTYRVTFWKKAEGSQKRDELLGTVEIDDMGTSTNMPLMAKAFRHAPPRCFSAEMVQVQKTSHFSLGFDNTAQH